MNNTGMMEGDAELIISLNEVVLNYFDRGYQSHLFSDPDLKLDRKFSKATPFVFEQRLPGSFGHRKSLVPTHILNNSGSGSNRSINSSLIQNNMTMKKVLASKFVPKVEEKSVDTNFFQSKNISKEASRTSLDEDQKNISPDRKACFTPKNLPVKDAEVM